MIDINIITLSGRLTKDAELKMLPTGTSLTVFDLANNTGFGKNAKVMFVKVNIWGKTGETLLQYLKKGTHLAVTGTLELNEWESTDKRMNKQLVINSTQVVLLGSSSVPHYEGGSPSYATEGKPVEYTF